MISPEPLYRRALRRRIRERSRSARSRLALVGVLRQAGCEEIDLHVVRSFSRPLQGEAYLWAIAKIAGEHVGAPPWLR
jgi:hypothetical protein